MTRRAVLSERLDAPDGPLQSRRTREPGRRMHAGMQMKRRAGLQDGIVRAGLHEVLSLEDVEKRDIKLHFIRQQNAFFQNLDDARL